MARVLCAWELGGQLSHLANVAIVARRAAAAGHEVGVALRELHAARAALGDVPRRWYQAPASRSVPERAPGGIGCYAEMLLASGYADPRELRALLDAWRALLDAFAPDAVVFDHAPTAMLASRGRALRRIVIGSGFLVPPPAAPLGVFPDADRTGAGRARMREAEARVLEAAGRAGAPPLGALADLFAEADAELLLTIPELDPFPQRRDPDYLGVWTEGADAAPVPADLPERFVFAYLTAFPAHRALLGALREAGLPVRVYSRDIDAATRREVEGPELRFVDRLLDLPRVAARCALFVSHAAHSSVAQTLLGGVPQLMIPIYKEQLFTALRVRALGAGRVEPADRASYAPALRSMLDEPAYAAAARAIAGAHAGFDADAARRRVAERLDAVLWPGAGRLAEPAGV